MSFILIHHSYLNTSLAYKKGQFMFNKSDILYYNAYDIFSNGKIHEKNIY